MSVTLQAAAAATGNGNPLDVTGAPGAALQVSGTFVGTVIFEQTTDGVAWRRLSVSSAADGTAGTQATAPGTFAAALAGATGVRARVSAYTSGAITVIGLAGGAALPPLAADLPTFLLSQISDAGNAASKNTGTSSSTVALGNHTHTAAMTLVAAAAPATPAANAVVLYNEGGVLKAKADDGFVTTLAGRTP